MSGWALQSAEGYNIFKHPLQHQDPEPKPTHTQENVPPENSAHMPVRSLDDLSPEAVKTELDPLVESCGFGD